MARQPPAKEDRSVRLLKVGERVRHVLSELLTRQRQFRATLREQRLSIAYLFDGILVAARGDFVSGVGGIVFGLTGFSRVLVLLGASAVVSAALCLRLKAD